MKSKNNLNSCSELLELIKTQEVSAHYWHLNAESEPHHRALKDYYSNLNDFFDTIAEYLIGTYGFAYIKYPEVIMPILPSYVFQSRDGFSEYYIQEITNFRDMLNVQLDGHSDDLVLQDMIISGIQDCTKTLYLLSI